jgi:hypothetical protein
MKLKKQYIAIAIVTAYSSVTLAGQTATIIKNKSSLGFYQDITITKEFARIDTGKNRYMLVNLNEKKMYAVDNDKKVVINFSEEPKAQQKPPIKNPEHKVETKVIKKGDGPKIAGYTTVEYQILANGKVCSNEFVSADALNIEHVKEFALSMKAMTDDKRKTAPKFMQAPCMMAKSEAENQFMELGLPIRTVSKDGKILREITEINTKVSIKDDVFLMPKGYAKTTPQEMMKKLMGDFAKNMPKEGGTQPKMTPEQQEAMKKRFEEMLKKSQQEKLPADK